MPAPMSDELVAEVIGLPPCGSDLSIAIRPVEIRKPDATAYHGALYALAIIATAAT